MRDEPPINAQDFLRLVQRLSHQEGFIPTDAQFPGLTLIKPGPLGQGGRLIFAEVQGAGGRQSGSTMDWQLVLEGLGPLVEVYLWRPKNWEEIQEILKNGRKRS